MKYLYLLITTIFLSFGFPKSNINDVVGQVSVSFKNGNTQLLQSIMASQIELKIESEKIAHSKLGNERASMILSSFFKKNPPSSFKYLYQGNSSANLKYCVGNYHSGSKDFLVYMLISEIKPDKFAIKSLQLKEN